MMQSNDRWLNMELIKRKMTKIKESDPHGDDRFFVLISKQSLLTCFLKNISVPVRRL